MSLGEETAPENGLCITAVGAVFVFRQDTFSWGFPVGVRAAGGGERKIPRSLD